MNIVFTNKRLARNIFAVLALGIATFEAHADTTGYLTGQNGAVVKSGTDRCLHSGSWPFDLAVAECDADRMLQHVVAGTTAGAIAPPSNEAKSVSTLLFATVSKGTEKIILAEDTLFEYDKSIIKPSGKAIRDNIGEGIGG